MLITASNSEIKSEIVELRLYIKETTHNLLVDISRREHHVDSMSEAITKNKQRMIRSLLREESVKANRIMKLMLRLAELEGCLKLKEEFDALR